jgi:hypothetical protein
VSPILTFGRCIPHDKDHYQIAMDACFWLLSACDEVWFFGEWEKSKGCKLEYDFALSVGFKKVHDTEFITLSRGGGRITRCPECLGVGCPECYEGLIRLVTRTEMASKMKVLELREQEIRQLRSEFPKSALIPCGVCGKLMQDHSKIGGFPLCPM